MTAAVRQAAATTRAVWLTPPCTIVLLIVIVSNVLPPPAAKNRVIIPTSRPTSPTRLVRKALRAASLLGFSSHQWPIRANEQTPTSSQPTIICKMLSLRTKNSIEAVNSDKNAKKWV